ncbi:MAG: UDP-glucose 4-epimerase GalE [Defluviitaleaceae bacterium]|nr:UDP-glucose 4-epimerase GalE [Defluviitaleaceae bacterium]MCL2263591.1 UDP-glucose 4-epimerase GalE [Defluviitaleaceae bacterium]
MKILVTGGAGYIGSHTCTVLLENGYDIVVADNLANSSMDAIDGIKKITQKSFPFYKTDLCDEAATEEIFASHKFDCVIHFAGLKAVAESVAKPIMYYENNLISTLNICKCMKKHRVPKIIFSSSAVVYKNDNPMPLTEDSPLGSINAYGWSKFMCEQILRDFAATETDFSVVSLRYFNPVGAHTSGLIGEEPSGIPNNLMPFIAQTARGIHSEIKIFGNDYDTPDGTGIRDYIHVMDLAEGHMNAINFANKNTGFEVFNLGTGRGVSVLEMITTFETVNGLKLPYSIAPRRAGDLPVSYTSPKKAEKILGFKAKRTIEDMCRDTWNFRR